MKYIFTRIALLLLSVIVIYFISDYIQEHQQINEDSFNFEGVYWFFKLMLALTVISLSFFTYEAYTFHKKQQTAKRNTSLLLIGFIVFLVILFSGYFFQFAI